jgi:aspartate-semialdehyde dehydrogenase
MWWFMNKEIYLNLFITFYKFYGTKLVVRIALVGATGEVGRKVLKELEENRFENITLFASKKSAGKKLNYLSKEVIINELTEKSFDEKFDYILFTAGSAVSKVYFSKALENCKVAIDNSSAFRMDEGIPLVIPEINGNVLKGYKGLVANPNCSTIQMLLSLNNIYKKYGIEEIVVSTYQAVSGSGNKGISELANQENGDLNVVNYPKQIFRNVIPEIGPYMENDFTEEEVKMVRETKKIFNDDNIEVYPTAVRVPVYYGHSESILVRTKSPLSKDDFINIMKNSENVVYSEDIVTPLEIEDSKKTYVSRIRAIDEKTFMFWNVADNVRVGAATNAVRIMQKHIELNN